MGSFTFPADPSAAIGTIFIEPFMDNIVEFEESVTLTLIRNNGYIVPSGLESATIWISDNFGSNVFTVVARDLPNGAGIGYHPGTNSLIVSVNSFTNADLNFVRIDSNGVISPWSGLQGNSHEKKLTIAQTTTSGFTRGEVYFGGEINDTNGTVGRISPDGSVWTNTWALLGTGADSTNALLRGSLCFDNTGYFGQGLVVVTGGDSAFAGGQVWRIDSQANPTHIVTIPDPRPHLEGVIIMTNDVQKWGPWAGKILAGAESKFPPVIHAIGTGGEVTSFSLAIEPEDFDLVQTNQDLYCLSDPAAFADAQVLKLSRSLLTNFWGQLLITQEGTQHLDRNPPPKEGKLFFVQWDNATTNFVIRRISLNGFFEQVTFAPITIPDL